MNHRLRCVAKTFTSGHAKRLSVVVAVLGLVGTGLVLDRTRSATTAARRTPAGVQQDGTRPHPAPATGRAPGSPAPRTVAPSTPPSATSGASLSAQPPVGARPESCTVDHRLVPRCGLLWGVAPGAYTDLPASRALRNFEETTGREADIVHAYHRGDEVFPTADEAATVRQARKRVLFVNWKVAWGATWAEVARGAKDARIDRAAARLKAFPGRLFLALHHEPENDVRPGAGSGMTSRDFVAMYRHTVQRLRAAGVTNVVFVMIYMAYEPWCVQPWFAELWPGDDVVDWVGFDPYLFARPGGYGHGDFTYLVNRTSNPARWPGFYNWVTRTHGNKPLMVAEWGVYEYLSDPTQKAWIFSTVRAQLSRYPAIKALVYFDSPTAPKGDTRPNSTAQALRQFKALADSDHFTVVL
jgi:hypothetical protein